MSGMDLDDFDAIVDSLDDKQIPGVGIEDDLTEVMVVGMEERSSQELILSSERPPLPSIAEDDDNDNDDTTDNDTTDNKSIITRDEDIPYDKFGQWKPQVRSTNSVPTARHQKGTRARGCPCCDPDNIDNTVDKILFLDTPL